MNIYTELVNKRLEEAVTRAGIIPKEMQWKIPYLQYLGSKQTYGKNVYYYYDKDEDKYYSEWDIDREMRGILKKNKFQNRRKN